MKKAPTAWRERFKRAGKTTAYKIRWRETDPVTGKIRKGSSPLIYSAAEAATELECKNTELADIWQKSQAITRTSSLPLHEIFKRWHDSRLAAGEIRTGYAHEATLAWKRVVTETGWKSVADITADNIDEWITSRGGKGVQKPHLIIRSVLHFANERLRQPVDQFALAITPKRGSEKSQPPLLTAAQITEIRSRASLFGHEVLTLIDHLSLFGCRPVDACRCLIARWDSEHRLMTRRGTETKNKKPVVHPVMKSHAADLDHCALNRSPSDHLFLHPEGRPWRLGKSGGAAELTDWYWNNISSQIASIGPDQRGIYCLKDYAITQMEIAGIDDRTKSTFTGIFTLSVYQRYKSTNRTRQDDALAKFSTLPPLAE